jgi:hydrogenase maturation factor
VGLVLLVGHGCPVGVFSVATIENRFVAVNDSTTTINSTVGVHTIPSRSESR